MKKNFYLAMLVIIPSIIMAQKSSVIGKNNFILPRLPFWTLRGNSHINDTLNFLGTTDEHRLVFRVNNKQSGLIDFDPYQLNTTFGYQTLNSISQYGYQNTAFGYQALFSNTDGRVNIAIGAKAMYSNTTGYRNLALGDASLYSNIDGIENTGLGHGTLNLNSNGSNNVAVGWNSLASNDTGSDNTGLGYNSLYYNQASENTAVGYYSAYNNSFGTYNTSGGYLSLFTNNVGNNNTAAGAYASYNTDSGSNNTAYGMQALLTNRGGNGNTALGSGADVTNANFKNSTAIGFGAKVNASNKVQIGNMFVKSIGGIVGWTNYSDERIKQDVKENVPGLSFIRELKPVTYRLNIAEANELLGKKDSLNLARESSIDKTLFTGFLAQDVDKAASKLSYDFSGIDKSGSIMGLRYSEFVVPLVKAVQELDKKTEKINELENKIQQLTALVEKFANTKLAANGSFLSQNNPNPSKGSTVIPFSIAAGSRVAALQIFETASGKLMQNIALNVNAKQVTLNTSSFQAGIYTYSLIVDGQSVDSKQMVLNK